MNLEAITQLTFVHSIRVPGDRLASQLYAGLPGRALVTTLADMQATAHLLGAMRQWCGDDLKAAVGDPRYAVHSAGVTIHARAAMLAGETVDVTGFVAGLGQRLSGFFVTIRLVARSARRELGDVELHFLVAPRPAPAPRRLTRSRDSDTPLALAA